jgi:alcohol dehydrogenase
MLAVTYQEPGRVEVEERPDPQLLAADDAIVRIEASGICGSDLHIYHGRVQVEPGFTIGHEFVGTVEAVGPSVTQVAVGDRVLGCFHTACGTCFFCRRGLFVKCDDARVYGHGSGLGNLQGSQAQRVLVPHANLGIRRVPDGVSDASALFAGDVMGTAYHGVVAAGIRPGDNVAVIGLGPVGLCAVMVANLAGAAHVIAVDPVADRGAVAEQLGATYAGDDPRGAVGEATGGRGVDLAVEAVGHPDALETAIRLTCKGGTLSVIGVYAERQQVHMGLIWIKSLTLVTGQANVIKHVDPVLELMTANRIDIGPLVSREMPLTEAPDAYAAYAERSALKIVLRP